MHLSRRRRTPSATGSLLLILAFGVGLIVLSMIVLFSAVYAGVFKLAVLAVLPERDK